LRKAKALGCHWVEFDVRLTADSQPVLLHDNRLERTTTGRGRVSALSLDSVRHHDAGSRFHASFAGERVPTLEEALMLLAELGLGANVELKAARGKEAATGAVVAELLARTWPADPSHLLISSFQHGALAAARDRAPHIARGILFRHIPKNWRNIAAQLGCVTIHADQQRLRLAVLSEIRRSGYPLLAYTVNDPERARILFDFGVKSVFSDVPDHLRGAAAASGGLGREIVANSASAAVPRQGSVW
jgi:glycerophosphoryl diester phosphodiesterase